MENAGVLRVLVAYAKKCPNVVFSAYDDKK